jgi:hypothetical protein
MYFMSLIYNMTHRIFSKQSVAHIKRFGPLLPMIASKHVSPSQRKRLIDSLSNSQIRGLVSMLKDIERNKHKLPSEVDALMKSKSVKKLLERRASPSSKKSALKQRGGQLGVIAGALASQLIPGIISGIGGLFKKHHRRRR